MSGARPAVQAVTATGRLPYSQLVAGEVAEFTYDAAADLGAGQGVTAPAVSLVDTRTGLTVAGGATLDSTPVVGTVIYLRVTGVQRGGVYELRIQFDHTSPRVSGERTIKLHRIEGM